MKNTSGYATLRYSQQKLALTFMMPCLLVLLFVAVFPLAYNLWISFYNLNIVYSSHAKFIFLRNYINILSSGIFWHSTLCTLYFGGLSLLIEFTLGLLIALLLNQKFHGKTVVQTVVMLPMAATPVAVSYVWRIMYNPDFGIINYALHSLHLPGWNGIFDAGTAMPSLILVDVWQWTPFLVLIFHASLLSLPREALEAADVDGANAFQKFFFVTFPLMRKVVTIGVVLRGIDLFKTFDIIYSLTGGGPGRLTETLNIYTYNTLFTDLENGVCVRA